MQLLQRLRIVEQLVAVELTQLADDVVQIARAHTRFTKKAAEVFSPPQGFLIFAPELTDVAVVAITVRSRIAAKPGP